MKIKVCGLKYPDNINAVSALAPDHVGFIFYCRSPRCIEELKVNTLAEIPAEIKKTGVFVDENSDILGALIGIYAFDAIQLHGSEGPEYCAKFKGKVEVIKSFGLDENFDFNQLDAFADSVDYFLFDTKSSGLGGSGQTFDWNILNKYKLNIPFFLSGGLSLENLGEIKNIRHPRLYGVDLNSKFEIEPGMKDITKLEKAFDIIKQATNELRG